LKKGNGSVIEERIEIFERRKIPETIVHLNKTNHKGKLNSCNDNDDQKLSLSDINDDKQLW